MVLFTLLAPVIVAVLMLLAVILLAKGSRRGALLLFWHAFVLSLASLYFSTLGLWVFEGLARRGVKRFWTLYSTGGYARAFRMEIIREWWMVCLSGFVFLLAVGWVRGMREK